MNWKFPIEPIKKWYVRFERPISSLSLIGGFVFDALTLRGVDKFWDNVWVLTHFVIIAVCIFIINYLENKRTREAPKEKQEEKQEHFWLVIILQFFFGGLLSTFIVFYFRSGTLSVTWPFILLLAVAFVANESLKKHYTRLAFQISLFFLSIFSFAIFILPIILHQIGPRTFLLSGGMSVVLTALFVLILYFFARESFAKSWKLVTISVVSIFLFMNILYFFDLIPPLPLSLTSGGIYHSLVHTSSGYVVTTEPGSWLGFFAPSQIFHEVPGDAVYAHSAIFAPASLNTTIYHEWQYYNQTTGKWTTFDRIELSIIGGRSEGYNTYSLEYNVAPGAWRVNVETANGQIIGRLRFTVIGTTTEPAVVTETVS